jgi:glycosyltransferase involved in cell wall biosynthesis
MKILVDCRCLNYPFLTGVNSYTIRFLHCLSVLKAKNPSFKITSMGLKIGRMRELMTQFPFLLDLFDRHKSLAQYLNYQDSPITNSNWFHKLLEIKLITQNWFNNNLNCSELEKFDFVILPQPRLINLHPQSKLITIFHDIFSILDNHIQLPQRLIFNKRSCQSLINRSYKVVAGSISTCQDLNKTFFNKTGFNNPKIRLIYPALPNLSELEKPSLHFINQNDQNSNIDNNERTKLNKISKIDFAQDSTNINLVTLKSPYVLAISGIEPRKNWHNLLLAQKELQERYDWSLTLVLSGSVVDLKYYNKLIKLISIQKIKNVIWQINPSENQKNILIQNSEFVVYSSFYEGFGFPILEAFEYNKIVIASRISSMPEIGKNACVYTNPFNYRSIGDCMYLLNVDKQFKSDLENNISKIKTQYNWNEMTIALEKLLN